ncbi:hypothetical protein, partial [Natronorubrum sulfidifaciens]|uniref:hypothetical protein n=1 Tax=Natronorubrum sulfidifaciens TaxID=388259 RepID=UPI0012677CE6
MYVVNMIFGNLIKRRFQKDLGFVAGIEVETEFLNDTVAWDGDLACGDQVYVVAEDGRKVVDHVADDVFVIGNLVDVIDKYDERCPRPIRGQVFELVT